MENFWNVWTIFSKEAGGSRLIMSTKYIKRIEDGFKILKNAINEPIALAISGGPDSMALAWSAQQFLPKKNLKCYLVNHNTHKESGSFIEKTVSYLGKQGLDCEILNIHPMEFSEDNLRILRYNAIEKAIFQDKINHLVTGHHLDDDLETFFYRLVGQSGLTGLQGILPVSRTPMHKLGTIYRPLLSVDKVELIQLCKDNNIPFFVDPSNIDLKYKRNMTRDFFNRVNDGDLKFDSCEVFKKENFKEVSLFYKRIGRLNELRAESILKNCFLPDNSLGIGLLNLPKGEAWLNDEFLACNVLKRILQFIQPNSQPPRLANLKKFRLALINGIGKSVTTSNCWIRPPQLNSGKDNYLVLPAPPQAKLRLSTEVMLTDDMVPEGLTVISQMTSKKFKMCYDFIFNERHLMKIKFQSIVGEPLFKDIKQEIESTPKLSRHLDILSLKKYNLKVVYGSDAFLGQLIALLRILTRNSASRKAMPNGFQTDFITARKLRNALQHFATHTPMHSRSIAIMIVHVDEDGQQYPVAVPALDINLIRHVCFLESKFIGDMNYINK